MDRIIKGCFSAVLQIHFSRIGHTVSGYSRLLAKTLGVAAIFMSFGLSAQSISPQMMEQAKNLPRAQQEALARQYGVDLDQILGVTAGNEEQGSSTRAIWFSPPFMAWRPQSKSAPRCARAFTTT